MEEDMVEDGGWGSDLEGVLPLGLTWVAEGEDCRDVAIS